MVSPGEPPGFSDVERGEACIAHKLLLSRESLLALNFEISYPVRSSRDVGVDFLDSFCLSDGRLGIYLGDGVGKGVAAAMSGGLTIGTLRSTPKTSELPAAVLETFHLA